MKVPLVRMFIDENGHQTLKGDLSNNNNRFLCLTGIIMLIQEHSILEEALNTLKLKYFDSADIVLHRRELISAAPPFDNLHDPDKRSGFNHDFLRIVQDINYRVISVVIDKKALIDRYGILFARDPYVIALEDLMQRYQYWLQSYCKNHPNAYGDIVAEARGGGEDKITRQAYIEIYNGRGYNQLRNAADYYSSKEIKLKPKSANIAGLQFVDLISHPARRYILTRYGLSANIKKSSYEQQIADILVASKFRRSGKTDGEIEGYGIRLFPK